MDELPRALVRAYSNDLCKRDRMTSTQLQRIVGDQEQHRQNLEQDWRVYFESWKPSETEVRHAALRSEGVHLLKAWKTFSSNFPGETGEVDGRPPTVSKLINVIKGVSVAWDDDRKRRRFGGAKMHFHSICDNLKAHATMLELLPAGNEYVSLFTGSLTTIVKASVNHEKIIADIGKSLDEITDVVAECTEMCQMYNTEKVQMCIAQMYAHIFIFLNDIMVWFTDKAWKRALRSFNENFYDNFAEQISHIKKLAARVKHQAEMGLYAELRVTRIQVERLQPVMADMRIAASSHQREQAELVVAAKRLERKVVLEEEQQRRLKLETPAMLKSLADLIGDRMGDLLESKATHWSENVKLQREVAESTSPHSLRALLPHPADLSRTEPLGREAYLAASRDLELYFDRERMRNPMDCEKVMVSNEISHRLRYFVANAEEPLLAVAGPRSLDSHGLSMTTKVAASFISHAEEVGVPVASWFCDLTADSNGNSPLTSEETSLVALVYALIRQLIELLPSKPVKSIDVDIDELEDLDGTPKTLNTAIGLLEDLILQMNSTLFLVIDGLQWLDDQSTDGYLNDFVSRLVSTSANARESHGDGDPLVRILFTTTDRSRALLETLASDKYLLADQAGQPRRRQRGDVLFF